MLEIMHCYEWTEEESWWYNRILHLLYGSYLLIENFQLEDEYQKLELRNMNIEQLLLLEWDNEIKLNCKNEIIKLHGKIKIKIKYEPMQKRLLPEIIISKKDIKKNICTEVQALLNLCKDEIQVQFPSFSINVFNEFLPHFLKIHNIKRGFYDVKESCYFLLLNDDKVYELSSFGLHLLGNISIDLQIGFFGACENLLHEHWNQEYFQPWLQSKKISSIFPPCII